MSNIDKQTIEKIRDAVTIETIIGKFVTLRRSGSSFVGCCPFHGDTHPSMVVSPAKQRFKCFPCGAGGDVLEFVMKHENMSFTEALYFCANEAGIQIEKTELTPEERAKAKQTESLQIAIEAAAKLFEAHLPEAEKYMADRSFDIHSDLIRNFRIGYAPDGNVVGQDLVKNAYNPVYLRAVNVTKEGKYGDFDVFRDRIMFPFMDLKGNITGFSGRYITPKENTGKYVNTSDTQLFSKGRNLFGLYQAKGEIGRQKNAYLVEGQFDVLSMHASGVTNTIAGSGTALTTDQAKLIKRFTDTVTLVYDADKAGLNASLKNADVLLKEGLTVRCVAIPDGKDPDDISKEQKDKMPIWLKNRSTDFVNYFSDALLKADPSAELIPEAKEEVLTTICTLICNVNSETLRLTYIRDLAKKFDFNTELVHRKVKELLRKMPPVEQSEEIKPGIYGMEEIPELIKETGCCELTSDFDYFLQSYGDEPVVYIHDVPSPTDIQELRRICTRFKTTSQGMSVSKYGVESTYLTALLDMFKAGIQDIYVIYQIASDEEGSEDTTEREYTFVNAYLQMYGRFFTTAQLSDRTQYIERCAEVISLTDDSVRVVNFDTYHRLLGLTKAQLTEILKPYLAKRKSRMAINSQREDDEDESYDPDELPEYVENNPTYKEMYRSHKFYPKINKDGEPVCYMFQNDKGGHTQVGDFYMTPLLHILSDEEDKNKRVLKINRRYYKTPLFIEVPSKSLLKKTTIEEKLIMLEAVNFSNGEERHWTKIREYMSRQFVTCSEIDTYGNQQTDGFSRKEDNMFFAFANSIFHNVNGVPRIDYANDLGVVVHNGKNYYLPAFSTIYAGERSSDKYELISTLKYRDVPAEKQCSFEKWAALMDKVYSVNENGKWAILYAVMCAFRSNIHSIDRLFTAPFFMGPMSSGKTQIAISIRSLFISPKVPIFNLNIGTDAAMSTLMSTFRDVPVVLDEYNNKDISDLKFQALKGIVYDGDGRQKRKGTGGKEIENDKVYAPVVICGQETPQRDDNALMSRIVVCEVPKPHSERTTEEINRFQELKDIEDPDKCGLSNVLFQVLKLRGVVMDHYRDLKKKCEEELRAALPKGGGGDMVRITKTASLFLAMCKLLESYTELKLPFTYAQFFEIAKSKVISQVELISHTDKLATFFKSMDVMIDTRAIIEGRDFAIEQVDKVTIKQGGDEPSKAVALPAGTRVLFLRLSPIYTQFARSSYNSEESTQSTIEQNLRSNPAYIGVVNARRFKWYETVEVPRGGMEANEQGFDADKAQVDTLMVKRMEKREKSSSCFALNYETFVTYYDIDLERRSREDVKKENSESGEQDLPF